MTKRLTREYTNHLQRIEAIEEAIEKAIPPGQMKLEIIKALNNVLLDHFNDYVNSIFTMYEEE